MPGLKTIVVTGVSTGIGWGVAKTFAERGWRVFGSVRRQADAERLKAQFGEAFTPLLFDVTDPEAIAAGAARVRDALAGRRLDLLINNAGVSIAGPVMLLPVEDFRQQMDINLTSVVAVTQAFIGQLGMDPGLSGPPGRIANISSVGAKTSAPFLAAYVASKAGMEAYSDSLRRELLPFGIDVVIIAPGSVRSAIWEKAEQVDTKPFADTPYAASLTKMKAWAASTGARGLTPEAIGGSIFRIMTARRPRVRYTIAPDPVTTWIARLAPKRFLDQMLARNLGLLPGG